MSPVVGDAPDHWATRGAHRVDAEPDCLPAASGDRGVVAALWHARSGASAPALVAGRARRRASARGFWSAHARSRLSPPAPRWSSRGRLGALLSPFARRASEPGFGRVGSVLGLDQRCVAARCGVPDGAVLAPRCPRRDAHGRPVSARHPRPRPVVGRDEAYRSPAVPPASSRLRSHRRGRRTAGKPARGQVGGAQFQE